MLILVGLGLYIDLLPLRSLAALARCDKVLIDAYTSAPREAVERVYEVLRAMGKRVSLAKREDLEGESIARIAEEARHSDVCIAVLGDPLIATTHSAICTEAASRGVKVVVIPAPSIHCASITATGLMSYRFGRSVTLVTPKNGVFYEYPYDVIKENLSLNLHTLLLLEMDAEKGFFMDPCEAGRLLMELEKRRGEGVLRSDTLVVVLSKVASPRHSVVVTKLDELERCTAEFGEPPYTLVILAGKLHPIEEEMLRYASQGLLTMAPVADPYSTLREAANIFLGRAQEKEKGPR